MEQSEPLSTDFARAKLPWVVAAGALILYGLTLNHWVSLTSLPVVAKVTGWDWIPPRVGALQYLLTYPFHWLPVGWQPIALNCFSAVCAALSLGLLARCVALLPHDRTREQRQRERNEGALLSVPEAWLPPVFAALVAGLELTFWTHATALTGEMLDLLLFAYVVRCLLEFRLDPRESWLNRMALVYGIGVTNNFAMIGFFPCFLAALIWIKGRQFFDVRFMARLTAWGFAGLTLYLLLPLVHTISGVATGNFWQLLRDELGIQKSILLSFPRSRVLLLSLTSILPLLFAGIRWPSSSGDTSIAGALLSSFMIRLIHALFLVACLWVAFDPKFSPRQLGYGIPFLTFYYLGALAIGYFSGYFLLTARPARSSKSRHRSSGASAVVNRLLGGLVWVAFVGVPVGLIARNYPRVRAVNSTLVRDYATALRDALPQNTDVLFSDNPYEGFLIRALEPKAKSRHAPIVINTRYLPYQAYLKQLRHRFGQQLPGVMKLPTAPARLDDAVLSRFITGLVQTKNVCYLQPSFGYFLETIYLQPKGLVYLTRAYSAAQITPPALTPQQLEANRESWRRQHSLIQQVDNLIGRDVTDATVLGDWLSRKLDYWGVELQRADQLKEAAQAFDLALAANTNNVAALINRGFNARLQKGQHDFLPLNDALTAKVHQYANPVELLASNGPVDEPGFCFGLGKQFADSRNHRQAALQFLRVRQLQPHNLQAALWLGNMYLSGNALGQALKLVQSLRREFNVQSLSQDNEVELVRLEALAKFRERDVSSAEQLLRNTIKKYPKDPTLLDLLFYTYFGTQHFEQALGITKEQLRLEPDKLDALLNQGAIYIQMKQYAKAVPPLNRVLQLDPNNPAARLNRAIAYLQSNQLDAAEKDYEALDQRMKKLDQLRSTTALSPEKRALLQRDAAVLNKRHTIYYGLGEIAYRRKDVQRATHYYRLYLKTAPSDTSEVSEVKQRLSQLEANGAR